MLPRCRELPPGPSTGHQRSCPSTASSPNVCCSSSPTVETCCSRPPTVKRTQPHAAPALKVEGPSNPSNEPVRTPFTQCSTSSRDGPVSDDYQSSLPGAIDLEKGSAVDHAVTQISGMTCTGCERKLERVLSSIPGVHNVQTSLVLGRAEFDVDAGLSIDHVVSLLESKTEFSCTVRKERHRLEVLIPGPMLAPTLRLGTTAVASENGSTPLPRGLGGPPYPSGVEDIKIVHSKGREWNRRGANRGLSQRLGVEVLPSKPYKYRALILYNPHVVGARDLLEKGFGTPLSLAPLSSDQVATDAGHLRRALYMTLLSMIFTIPILIMAWAPLPPHTIAYGCISLVLATMVQFIVAGPFYPKALKALLYSAGGVGAKHGVIVKSPGAIENARNVSHVIFDKTGTLTQGQFVVVEEVYREETRKEAASIIKQLTANSKHPISRALATHLESLETGPIRLENVSSVVGKGIRATLEGQTVRAGNPFYVDAVEDLDVQRCQSLGLTVFCLHYDSALLAIFGLRDALRADTASVISSLQARNIAVSVVSGDSSAVVNKLARELGIPLSHVQGQCGSEDKARYVTSLLTAQTGSRKKGSSMTTIFCGDGSNDAVALAKADIGVYIAGGTDMAKNAADVVLTHASLAGIVVLMDLSRASMRRVHLNFVWSFLYNLFAILLTAGAFVTVRIPPAYAGLGELVSVLPVIAVAMQIRWMRFQK